MNRFPQLYDKAGAHGLHFLLIGGHAVGQHGYGRMIVNAGTFTKLQAESVSAQLFGLEMRIPRLEHLLALKFHALRGNKAIRSLKDMDDVINLIEINRLDVFSEEFKALTLRYGDQELFDKLRTIIRRS